MNKDTFLRNLNEVLDLQPGTLTGSERLEELPQWDSMAILSVIAMVDEKLGVVIPPAKLTACETINDIIQLCGVPVSTVVESV
jgi:acyl carrier protein